MPDPCLPDIGIHGHPHLRLEFPRQIVLRVAAPPGNLLQSQLFLHMVVYEITAQSHRAGDAGLPADTVHPPYEILIHGMADRRNLADRHAAVHSLRVGVAQCIGTFGGESSLYGCPGAEGDESHHRVLGLPQGAAAAGANPGADRTRLCQHLMVIQIPRAHHVQKPLLIDKRGMPSLFAFFPLRRFRLPLRMVDEIADPHLFPRHIVVEHDRVMEKGGGGHIGDVVHAVDQRPLPVQWEVQGFRRLLKGLGGHLSREDRAHGKISLYLAVLPSAEDHSPHGADAVADNQRRVPGTALFPDCLPTASPQQKLPMEIL